MDSYELIEHTADVGVIARSDTLEGVFEQTAWGLLDVMGAVAADRSDTDAVEVNLDSGDLGGLLVDWLNELLWVQESSGSRIAAVNVTSVDVGGRSLSASIHLDRSSPPPDGTGVKAATFHQLDVAEQAQGWSVRVYLDV